MGGQPCFVHDGVPTQDGELDGAELRYSKGEVLTVGGTAADTLAVGIGTTADARVAQRAVPPQPETHLTLPSLFEPVRMRVFQDLAKKPEDRPRGGHRDRAHVLNRLHAGSAGMEREAGADFRSQAFVANTKRSTIIYTVIATSALALPNATPILPTTFRRLMRETSGMLTRSR